MYKIINDFDFNPRCSYEVHGWMAPGVIAPCDKAASLHVSRQVSILHTNAYQNTIQIHVNSNFKQFCICLGFLFVCTAHQISRS